MCFMNALGIAWCILRYVAYGKLTELLIFFLLDFLACLVESLLWVIQVLVEERMRIYQREQIPEVGPNGRVHD